jgi:uncharacterized membrane protein YoaK (UPF0700 family)
MTTDKAGVPTTVTQRGTEFTITVDGQVTGVAEFAAVAGPQPEEVARAAHRGPNGHINGAICPIDVRGPALPIRVRNVAAMVLAVASGATDAIGYLALGQVFTSAMTGNLVLLGIAVAHRHGERIGRLVVSLVCFIVGAALGARIARSPEPDDPVWPSAVTRALAVEAVIFVGYGACWWIRGLDHGVVGRVQLGLGAVAVGIQSAAMRRFGRELNTTFLSGSLTTLVGWLATGHRLRDIRHHLLVLVGLVGGAIIAALLVLHAPVFAPAVQLVALAAALCVAGWQARVSGVVDHADHRMARLLSTVRTRRRSQCRR